MYYLAMKNGICWLTNKTALTAAAQLEQARTLIEVLISSDSDGYPYWYDGELGECVYCRGGERLTKSGIVTHDPACPVTQAQEFLQPDA